MSDVHVVASVSANMSANMSDMHVVASVSANMSANKLFPLYTLPLQAGNKFHKNRLEDVFFARSEPYGQTSH